MGHRSVHGGCLIKSGGREWKSAGRFFSALTDDPHHERRCGDDASNDEHNERMLPPPPEQHADPQLAEDSAEKAVEEER